VVPGSRKVSVEPESKKAGKWPGNLDAGIQQDRKPARQEASKGPWSH